MKPIEYFQKEGMLYVWEIIGLHVNMLQCKTTFQGHLTQQMEQGISFASIFLPLHEVLFEQWCSYMPDITDATFAVYTMTYTWAVIDMFWMTFSNTFFQMVNLWLSFNL